MLLGFFDAAWRRWPDRAAIDIPPGRDRPLRAGVTYAELAARASDIASVLRGRITPGAIVALLLPRTAPDAFAAELAVLRAGGAYLALDPSFPEARLAAIAADAGPAAFLTDAAGEARLASLHLGVPVVNLDRPIEKARPSASPSPASSTTGTAGPQDLAYVIYTSGTSGRPKGVLVEHGAIANLVQGDVDEFALTADDRVAQGSSHAYDSSIEEMWLAWAAGATLVVMDDDAVRAGPDLPAWLRDERITVLCPPPTLLRTMPARAAAELPALKLIYAGGEAMTPDLVAAWAPGRRLVNGYGPTECAVTAIRGDVRAGEPVTIGRPVPGVRARILDEALQEISGETRGELCLEGAGLARGYQGAPAETAARFPVHPTFGRIYRTGDLAHRASDGRFYCHGRIDAQVKLRGYRVELEEIEAHLGRCPGVRTAACRVSGESSRHRLTAFLVADPSIVRPSPETLRDCLARSVPPYMIPTTFRWIDALPVSTGGKLNRAALPSDQEPDADAAAAPEASLESGSELHLEARIERALRALLRLDRPIVIDDDFFHDLGGDSLLAAEFTTSLRDDPATALATVRDVYEAPTIRRLAARLGDTAGARAAPTANARPPDVRARAAPSALQVITVTLAQGVWLLLTLLIVCASGYAVVAASIEMLGGRPVVQLIALVPVLVLAGSIAYAAVTLAAAVLIKRLMIGRYKPGRVPMWSGEYVRHWIVRRAAGAVPWGLFAGTELQMFALRALGARVGRRVHIHRGVDLRQGGWDLLDIGDDVTVGADGELRLVDLDAQQLVVGPIAIGDGATIETRAGVSAYARLEAGAYLTALSDLPAGAVIPAGECWSGVPARPAGSAPVRSEVTTGTHRWSPARWTATLLAAEAVTTLVVMLPAAGLLAVAARRTGASPASALEWLIDPVWTASSVTAVALLGVVPIMVTVWWSALVMRLIGRVPAGVVPRESAAYARVWIKTGLLERAGHWLSGTVMWPAWLRASGAEIGAGCEISTIIDVVPEHLAIGRMTFLADGVYLGGPVVHRGSVRLTRTELGTNVFVGNHAVIPAGQRVVESVLIGVATVATPSMEQRGTSWFGQPPFALPRKATGRWDHQVTHDPTPIRYVNRLCWEWLRFALPIVPIVTAALAGQALGALSDDWRSPWFVWVVLPGVTMAAGLGVALLVLALKWLLLGRVRPGEHPLWSCWCSRWDFLYVAWGQLARPVLSSLEGTLWLAWYLRGMGARIGRRVALGEGFAQMVDPDMLEIEDDATVQAQFQAHTFEDRVLKIDRVRIRRGATVAAGVVLLYGADLGPGATVAAHSVVMKREHLRAGRTYVGCPTKEV